MLIIKYIKIVISCFVLFSSCYCYSDEKIILHDIEVRSALAEGYPTSIYFIIENKGEILDYLMSVELIDYPKIKTTINKSIFEKKIARIIEINRLALPANTMVTSHPLHIYIIATGIPPATKKLNLKFIFASGLEIVSRR